jgi:hypothetical protein
MKAPHRANAAQMVREQAEEEAMDAEEDLGRAKKVQMDNLGGKKAVEASVNVEQLEAQRAAIARRIAVQ